MLTRTDKEFSLYSLATGAAQCDNLPTQAALSQSATLEKCVILSSLYQLIETSRDREEVWVCTPKKLSRSCLAIPLADKEPVVLHDSQWCIGPAPISGEQWDAHKELDVYLQ